MNVNETYEEIANMSDIIVKMVKEPDSNNLNNIFKQRIL
jgi:hypothetical protein